MLNATYLDEQDKPIITLRSNGMLVLVSGKEKSQFISNSKKRNRMLKMEEKIYAVLIRKMGHYVLDSGCPY